MSHMQIFLKIMVSTVSYREKSYKWLLETNFSSGILHWIYRISKYFVIFKWRFLRQAFAPFIYNFKKEKKKYTLVYLAHHTAIQMVYLNDLNFRVFIDKAS